MSAIQKNPLMTEAEYLEFERASETKHEFFRGEIFAMAGASREHDLICQNLTLYLLPQARKNDCETHTGDMRLKVLATGLFTYPDFTIYCDVLIYTGDKPDTLTNPSIIFEVLSPSTKNHDRETKFHHYQQIPSLQEYVLVSQEKPCIERFLRQDDGTWNYLKVEGLEGSIDFPSVGASLALANAYEQVDFSEESKP
jgi:Uma2 family endonuclease